MDSFSYQEREPSYLLVGCIQGPDYSVITPVSCT